MSHKPNNLEEKLAIIEHYYPSSVRTYASLGGDHIFMRYTMDFNLHPDERLYISSYDENYLKIDFGGVGIWCPTEYVTYGKDDDGE